MTRKKPSRRTPKPPARIRIAGVDVRLVACDRYIHDETFYGDWSHPRLEIRYSDQFSRTHVADTVLHELGHAIYSFYGLQEDDGQERVVSVMATAWTQIYSDNPALLSWLKEMLS